MTAASLLARGRAAAERLMVDSATIRRQTGTVTDPNTGVITPTYTTVYSGKCRVQQRSEASASPTEAGDARVLMLRTELQLPMSATGFRVGDEVVDVVSAHDPDLTGREFTVRDLAHGTHKTARRLGVVERTG
ncbi:MAG TPA: DUF6093 family protein [Jiangellales bacterium]|nr:DUF6093 family protein [Jiangellales bacterium]